MPNKNKEDLIQSQPYTHDQNFVDLDNWQKIGDIVAKIMEGLKNDRK